MRLHLLFTDRPKSLVVRSLQALLFATLVCANTEKTIFRAPQAISLPDSTPSLDNLRLHTLTDTNTKLRTSIAVSFANSTDSKLHGEESWYLLRGLRQDQRYEVRVCWSALQPTNFNLEAFELGTTFDTPELVQSLAAYSEGRQQLARDQPIEKLADQAAEESLLFLRVRAAADFYSTNKTLMLEPPDVVVDLILDPYLLNVFPKSLVPTAGYICHLEASSIGLKRKTARGLSVSLTNLRSILAYQTATAATYAQMAHLVTPSHPFYSLPPELILDIVDLLPAESFINFVFANYPLLHATGLAPNLSRREVCYITTRTQIPNLFPLLKMPAEMTLQIISHLKPLDIMRFVVANYQDLERQGIAPPMTAETAMQLRRAVGTQIDGG